MKRFLAAIVAVFAPLILVAAGVGVGTLGLNYSISFLAIAGLVLILAGIVWGVILVLMLDSW